MFQLPSFGRASHRTRIVLLVLGSGLPVLALAVFGLWRYLDASKQELVDDRVATAQASALTTQAFISHVVSSAQTLALSPEVTDPSHRSELSSLLERVRLANPQWNQVAVLDAYAETVASSGTAAGDALPLRTLVNHVLADERPGVGTFHAPNATSVGLLVGVPLRFADGTTGVLLVSPSLRVLTSEL